jgi:CheY-like chemotaxis protein
MCKILGIGIQSEMYEEIFKRYRQLEPYINHKSRGSGLGLSISKAYVEILGGKIWLNSDYGKGTVFYFTIPYKQVNERSLSGNVTSISENDKTKEKTILIVEDDDTSFYLLEEFLKDMEIFIIRAPDGLRALEICNSDKQIDLVLMDIKMPVMNGFEATKLIKAIRPSLHIVAQTAVANNYERTMSVKYGCSDFIDKPIDRLHLRSIIEEYLMKVE